jgi:alpha(1,3/1,4) fucosyltransferase
MKSLYLSLLLFCGIAHGQEPEKRIECVGVADTRPITALLQKRNYVFKAVSTDWSTFGQPFKKNKSWSGKLKQKIKSPSPIQLDPLIAKVIFMNIPNHLYRDYRMKDLPKNQLVLFMWEPRMHARKMYNKALHDCFSRVYTWDDDLVDRRHYFKFFYPVLSPMLEKIPAFEEKKLCTLVSGCHLLGKDFAKKYPSELYSERRKAVLFFEAKQENGFDLYGRGWDKAINPSYKGPISDKIDVIKNYRFSICYENCREVKGYITEKIFDCFAAGNVPIYWGASNITDYIPKDCFIDRRDFASMEELYLFMKNRKKAQYEGYISRIRHFLTTDQAGLFSKEAYEQTLFEALTI